MMRTFIQDIHNFFFNRVLKSKVHKNFLNYLKRKVIIYFCKSIAEIFFGQFIEFALPFISINLSLKKKLLKSLMIIVNTYKMYCYRM